MPAASPGLETVTLGGGIVIGVARGLPRVDPAVFDVLLTDVAEPPRPWVNATPADLEVGVARAPGAARVLVDVLRATEGIAVPEALVVESLAYSMLQHGGEFERWLATEPRREHAEVAEPVLLARSGSRLDVTLARPEVHNAFDTSIRDGLISAFELIEAAPEIAEMHLRGLGPSFSSGGDLSEFGLARDPVEAHRVRIERSVAVRVHDNAQRVTAHLHGSCLGAGIEVPAFAATVLAAPGTAIGLPELSLGLIPGAGGTVSIPRRIGRHRCAFLALSGRRIDAGTALAWGLVDGIDEAG
ncbi:MAG: enoyl-CoA hydratase/isomerase family protein [Microthrixaceae bacterium]